MQGSEPRTQPQTPEYGILNHNKSQAFFLDEHQTRMDQVWADFEEFQEILCDLEKRVDLLEKNPKEANLEK